MSSFFQLHSSDEKHGRRDDACTCCPVHTPIWRCFLCFIMMSFIPCGEKWLVNLNKLYIFLYIFLVAKVNGVIFIIPTIWSWIVFGSIKALGHLSCSFELYMSSFFWLHCDFFMMSLFIWHHLMGNHSLIDISFGFSHFLQRHVGECVFRTMFVDDVRPLNDQHQELIMNFIYLIILPARTNISTQQIL